MRDESEVIRLAVVDRVSARPGLAFRLALVARALIAEDEMGNRVLVTRAKDQGRGSPMGRQDGRSLGLTVLDDGRIVPHRHGVGLLGSTGRLRLRRPPQPRPT